MRISDWVRRVLFRSSRSGPSDSGETSRLVAAINRTSQRIPRLPPTAKTSFVSMTLRSFAWFWSSSSPISSRKSVLLSARRIRSEERRVVKEGVVRVELGGRLISKKKTYLQENNNK